MRRDVFVLDEEPCATGGKREREKKGDSPIQTGEMGDLGVSLARFLIWSSDLPMRASCSLANFAFRRRCSRVWACKAGGQYAAC